ncbi:hypothetical protein JIY74_30085 [Vibrio harveyi]|nr:hypothetical protein [Vibrio harveyi]
MELMFENAKSFNQPLNS